MTFRYSFLLKLAGAVLLVILADLLFWFQSAGSTIGLFAIAVLVVAACMRTDMFRRWPARLALAGASFFALALAFNPGPLALLLYWTALTLAALLPRTARFDDGWRWFVRLLAHGVLSPIGPLRDHLIASRARRRRRPIALRGKIFVLILPLVGSTIFLSLFAQANPLIGDFLSHIDFWPEFDIFTILRAIFWVAILIAMWSVLRPPRFVLGRARTEAFQDLALPGVSIASVAISLLAFNLIFALQNGLDLAYLWSGAALPEGMTLAEYAHRGAYPLIATALLAGLFVLVTLRPGAPTAASRPIRLLVTLWIGQNLLLVASTMLRTFDYVLAYSLTELRIAALIWMGLVALGPCPDLLPSASRQERRLADQRQPACRDPGSRRLHLARSGSNRSDLERAPCARGRRYRRRHRPLLPQPARPLRLAAADRTRKPAAAAPSFASACNGCAAGRWTVSPRTRRIGTAGSGAMPAASPMRRRSPPRCACRTTRPITASATAAPSRRRRPRRADRRRDPRQCRDFGRAPTRTRDAAEPRPTAPEPAKPLTARPGR